MEDKLVELIAKYFKKINPNSYYIIATQLAGDLRNNGVTFATDNNVPCKWIPVSERLPEKEGLHPYLVTDNRGNYSFSLFEPGKRMWIATWWERCITHWMPLPEPPKEGE